MIEFKDGKKFIQVKEEKVSRGDALVLFSSNGYQSNGVYLDKQLYNLLEQAMPHIKAIVEKAE